MKNKTENLKLIQIRIKHAMWMTITHLLKATNYISSTKEC